MLVDALIFLIDTAFGLIVYTLLLRFAMQWLRAPFKNPVGQTVAALTDWAVKPARRLLPGWRGVDWSTLLLAWLFQFAWLALVLVVRRQAAPGVGVLLPLALIAVVALVKAALYLLIIAVLVQAILSWIAPDGPLQGVLNALTFRFLSPIRRMIPPVGGVLDLSPLIVIVLAQLTLMLPVAWLERGIMGAFAGGAA